MTYSVIISTEDVYNTEPTKNISGFVRTGEFRPPRKDEYFLCAVERGPMKSSQDYPIWSPRIILRRPDEREVFIQDALLVLESIPTCGGAENIERLINKAKELLDV